MVKRKLRRASRRMPRSISRIVGGASVDGVTNHGGEGYANRVTAWIAARVSERADLLETNTAESGFFGEFAGRGIVERLILVHEAAR